jgi:hypothetical protein
VLVLICGCGSGVGDLGEPCESVDDCSSRICVVTYRDGKPDGVIGLCSQSCDETAACPDRTECVVAGESGEGYCLIACDSDEDCTAGPCELVVGHARRVCLPP